MFLGEKDNECYLPGMEFYGLRGKKLPDNVRMFAWWFAKTWNPELSVTKAGFEFKRVCDQKYYATRLLKNDRIKRAVMEAFRKQVKVAGIDEPEFAMKRVLKMFKQIEKVAENISSNLETKNKVSEEDIAPLVKLMELNKSVIEMTSKWLGYSDDGNSETVKATFQASRTFGGYDLPPVKREIPEANTSAIDIPPESPDENGMPVDSGDLSFENVLKTELLEKNNE